VLSQVVVSGSCDLPVKIFVFFTLQLFVIIFVNSINRLYLFNGLYSRTTWLNRYQKSEIGLDLNEARDDGVWGWQWHQLDHMKTICTSLQTGNHTSTSSLKFLQAVCAKPTVSKY